MPFVPPNARFRGKSGHFSQPVEGSSPPLPIEMNQEFGICRERPARPCAFVIHCCAAAIWMMGGQALRCSIERAGGSLPA